MCDQDHFEEDRKEFEALGLVTRKQFGVMLGAGIAMMLPQVANAVDSDRIGREREDAGRHRGLLLRPSGERHGSRRSHVAGHLRAAAGVPRRWPNGSPNRAIRCWWSIRSTATKKAPTADKGAATPIQEVMPLAQTLNETTHMTDAKAFIGWLDQQPAVAKNRKMGTQGYCMGGPMAFRTAAAVPGPRRSRRHLPWRRTGDQQAEQPASAGRHQQRAVPRRDRGQRRHAVAQRQDRHERDLRQGQPARRNRSLHRRAHGWCPPDSRVYNEPQAEKAWSRLLVLYGKALA